MKMQEYDIFIAMIFEYWYDILYDASSGTLEELRSAEKMDRGKKSERETPMVIAKKMMEMIILIKLKLACTFCNHYLSLFKKQIKYTSAKKVGNSNSNEPYIPWAKWRIVTKKMAKDIVHQIESYHVKIPKIW